METHHPVSLALVLALILCVTCEAADTKPHIIFIVADDLVSILYHYYLMIII